MAINKGDVFLEAQNVSISFPVPAHLKPSETEVGGNIRQTGKRKELVAVDNVSFRLEPGDSLGLIGHNGSGKTTLLRILAGILQPTTGNVSHAGKLGNALNTNIGFRNEISGRANIRLKALIAGQKRKAIPDIIDDVEDFAELGAFLDMPLHTYSAGMRARLAFGIATAFQYDILVLDEWLGAGDKRMHEKAAKRMQEFVGQSSITVIATHIASLLERTCNKAFVIDRGTLIFSGSVSAALHTYDSLTKREP
ncbi:MAG: ATP-binding cassette domain-containing protein [Pseudomonadota bacterium]